MITGTALAQLTMMKSNLLDGGSSEQTPPSIWPLLSLHLHTGEPVTSPIVSMQLDWDECLSQVPSSGNMIPKKSASTNRLVSRDKHRDIHRSTRVLRNEG